MKVTVLAAAFLLLSVGLYTGQCMKELPFGHAKIDCFYSANATYSFASPPALGGRIGPNRIVSSTQQIMEDRRRRLQHADTLVVADILSVDLIGYPAAKDLFTHGTGLKPISVILNVGSSILSELFSL